MRLPGLLCSGDAALAPLVAGRVMQRVVLERFVAEDGRIRIDLEVAPAVGYATVSSRLAAVRRLSVTNIGDQPVAGLRLTIELLSTGGLISPPWTVTPQKALLPESILTWEDFGALAPSLAVLREIDETFTADYRAVASHAEGPSLRMVAPTTVLAHNEWFNSPALQDSLAAFVQPSSYAVDTVLRAAAGILLNRTGSAALQGYQAGPDRAIMIAGAVYEGLRGLGLRVRKPPGDGPFEQAAHRIRMTSAVLNQRAGTALDLSVTYAACLGAAGLRPLIWLSRQHAFAGLLPDERTLGATVVTDHETILSLVDSGLVIPVELTGIGGGEAASVDFTDAVAAGLENFRTVEVLSVVDVALAHRSDIQPIASGERPVSEDMPTSIISPVITTAAGEAGRIVLPEGVAKTRLSRHSSEGDEAPPLADPAPARIRRWKKALLDLSLRNPLLNLPSDRYKGVDLHLAAGSLAVLDDLIHDGDPLHLVADHNLAPEDLTSRLTAHRRVELSLSPQRYVATMRTLQRDARTMQQETGGNYLYLTLGTLVHPKTGGGQASAPLFLLPVRIEGGAGGSGYSLVIDGPEIAAPNHCLVEWLRVKHDVRVPQLEYPAQDEHGIDIPKALAAISAGLVEHQLPYHVEERASLRLLQFPTFQLWRDLTDHWATFLENPVVRHLVTAGGEPFADPAGNDHCPQVDEASLHLPIPADGSQMRAVMMAERGQSFVLEGPPGTGKSQTITNLIARCIASGRTVLFVAEKEAALDVVRSRLARIGLAPFVLNLHGRKQSMNAIRQQLLEALAQYDRSDPAAWKATVAAYQTMIAPLIAYPDRVHRPNASGLSTWSAYEALLATDDSPNDGTVDGPVAPIPPEYLELPDERRARVELALRELPMVARSAGLRPGHPWACCGRHTVTGLDASVVTGIAANLEAIRSQLAQRPSLVTLLRGLASPFELAELLPAVRLAVTGTLAGRAPTSVVATTQPDATGEHAALRREVDPAWEGNASAVEADLAMFHQTYIAELHAFRPEIYDHAALDAWYEEARDAGARLFGRAKRLATISDRLAAYLRTPTPLDPDALERLLARLLAIRSHESAINQRVRELGCLGLPPGWRPVDATALARFAEAKNASVITGQLQTRHPAVLALLERGISADDADLLERLAGGWGSWSTSLQIGEAEVLRWVAGLHWLDAWQRDGQQWLTDLREGQLRAIWRWGALLSHADVLAEAGLTQLRELLLSGELPMPAAELAYRRGVATTALAERLRSEGLEYFDAEAHDARISQFAAVREELQTALTTRIPAGLLRRRPFDPADCHGRVAAVLAELNRRRGGKSFRDLYAAAADVILALTPCVLVSPASAATFLPPDATKFDLVVFDEASQIRTAEAIGPMGRGRATIVVGDSQQMPPSRMMRAAGGIADVDLGDEIAQLDELPEDRDSILREAVESQL
ncbi:MAG: DUF4011 domain-containing protein, partial [Micromonosporaceae bacterium]|nr:DUF4011 domain-containing protein [Micromonosporaceae bacterium]